MGLFNEIKKVIITIVFIVISIFAFNPGVLASTTEGNKIAVTGAKLACGTSEIYAERPYTRIENDSTRAYVLAREQYITEAPPVNGDGGEYASCDIAVATIVRASGVDPSFEPRLVPNQWNYLKNNVQKWKRMGTYYKGSSTASLEPGDVMIVDPDLNNSGNKYMHIWLYLGKSAVNNGNYDSVQASFSDYEYSSYYPTLFSTEDSSGDPRPYAIFRYNGRDIIKEIMRWGESNTGYTFEEVGDPCSIIDGKSGSLSNILSIIFLVMIIAGIIILIVMSIVEFVKAVVSKEEETIKRALKNSLIRILYMVILLLLPILLSSIINVTNKANDGKVVIGSDGKIFCDIVK